VDVDDVDGMRENIIRILRLQCIHIPASDPMPLDFEVAMHFLRRTVICFEVMRLHVPLRRVRRGQEALMSAKL
jgi:hypothetical protein